MRPFALAACWYLVPGVLWILGSDVLLLLFVHDAETLAWLSVAKGLGFVAITGAVIYRLLARQQAALQAVRERYDRTERGFQVLFTNNPLPVWAYDRETLRFLEINDVALAKYGYSRDELLTMKVTDVHTADELPALMDVIRRPREVRQRSGFWRHRLKDGRIIDVEVQVHDLELRGRPARVVVALDITERRRKERIERERASRARALADAAAALNLAATTDDIIRIATQAARSVIGAHAAMMTLRPRRDQDREMLAVSSYRLYEERPARPASLTAEELRQRVLERKAPVRLSVDDLRTVLAQSLADGQDAMEFGGWLAAPLMSRDGACIGVIQVADPVAEGDVSLPPAASFSDEDEAVLVQLAQMTAAAAENARMRQEELERERRFRELVEGLDAIVWEAEWPRLRFTFVSQQAETILGHPVSIWTSAHRVGKLILAREDYLALQSYLRDVAAGRATIPCEIRAHAADGSTVWLRVEASAHTDPTGAVTRLRGLTTDVTGERAQAEQVARGEKLRALGQLSSGAAHDLNQSLALIAGNGELLQQVLDERPLDTERISDLLEVIVRAASDGGETVRRMLTFVRSRHDEAESQVDLSSVVQEVVRLTAPRWRDASQAEGRPIELTVEIEGDAVIQGSPGPLREALTNLILNAVDALPHGGAIGIGIGADGDEAVLSLADSGVGMTEEVRARIFEPFFTTKGDRGTGLGLPTVYGIVEAHRGTLSVTSEPGKGARFELRFPLVRDGVLDTAQSAQPAAHAGVAAAPVTTGRRILVVDDEPQLVRMLATMLERDGYLVRQAGGGEDALAMLAEAPADLLITDVGMGPSMNGWELTERAHALLPGLTVILATGWGATIDPESAYARGVCAILAKPYRRADLQAALARVPWPAISDASHELPHAGAARQRVADHDVAAAQPARAS